VQILGSWEGGGYGGREVCMQVVRILAMLSVEFPMLSVVPVPIPPCIVFGGWMSLCVWRIYL
jgi:hypothetical protein